MLGTDVGRARWVDLARRWQSRTGGSVFNDIHAAIAYLRADAKDEWQALRAAMQTAAEAGSGQSATYSSIGIPVVDALEAFERGSYRRAADGLLEARTELGRMGGSHAQRDLVDWTLVEAAIRGGMRDVAVSLANERLWLRPSSLPNQRMLARAEALAS